MGAKCVRLSLMLAIIAAVAGAQTGAPAQAGQARITQGPTIRYTDDQFAVISWTTDVPGESRVFYGTDPNNLAQVAESRSTSTIHRVDLSDLHPSTTYYFRLDTGETGTVATHSFQTIAAGAAPLRNQQPAKVNQAPAVAITNGPLVQYTDENSAVITWSTNQPVATKLQYGTKEGNLAQSAEAPGTNTYHRVHLSNLQPNTTYVFRIDMGQAQAPESSFRTVAAGAQPVYDQQPERVAASAPGELKTRPQQPVTPAQQPAASTTPQLIVPAGTEIEATLQEALSSKTAKTGDTFTAVVSQPVKSSNGQLAIPVGTVVNGEVIEAEQGKTLPMVRGRGRLSLRFRDMTLPSHTSFPMTASLVSVHGSNANNEGEVTSRTSGTTAAKDVGIGAGIGTVAGLIFGSALKGLAIGAIAGGGYVLATQGKDVELPAKSGIKLKLDQSLTMPAAAARPAGEAASPH